MRKNPTDTQINNTIYFNIKILSLDIGIKNLYPKKEIHFERSSVYYDSCVWYYGKMQVKWKKKYMKKVNPIA